MNNFLGYVECGCDMWNDFGLDQREYYALVGSPLHFCPWCTKKLLDKFATGDRCPNCVDNFLEYDPGSEGSYDELEVPAKMFCAVCGLDFEVDWNRQKP
jgi:hypothetical protein